jgi:hypothetical protein
LTLTGLGTKGTLRSRESDEGAWADALILHMRTQIKNKSMRISSFFLVIMMRHRPRLPAGKTPFGSAFIEIDGES